MISNFPNFSGFLSKNMNDIYELIFFLYAPEPYLKNHNTKYLAFNRCIITNIFGFEVITISSNECKHFIFINIHWQLEQLVSLCFIVVHQNFLQNEPADSRNALFGYVF